MTAVLNYGGCAFLGPQGMVAEYTLTTAQSTAFLKDFTSENSGLPQHKTS